MFNKGKRESSLLDGSTLLEFDRPLNPQEISVKAQKSPKSTQSDLYLQTIEIISRLSLNDIKETLVSHVCWAWSWKIEQNMAQLYLMYTSIYFYFKIN